MGELSGLTFSNVRTVATEPKRKDRLSPDGRQKAHKTRSVPQGLSVETLRHSIATIAPVRSVVKKTYDDKKWGKPAKKRRSPPFHDPLRPEREQEKALRPRTIASRISGRFSGSRFAPLSPLPVSKNSEAMRVRPDYSGGAAPVSHRIPVHRSCVFDCLSSKLPFLRCKLDITTGICLMFCCRLICKFQNKKNPNPVKIKGQSVSEGRGI